MSKLPAYSLFKIIMDGKSSKRFLLATIFSFAFSMSVILGTLGLMGGFEVTLKQALAHSNGDIKFVPTSDFFNLSEELLTQLKEVEDGKYTGILEIESFALLEKESKGVLVRGVEPKSFKDITDLPVEQLKEGILVGKKFAEQYELNVGDQVVLAISSRKRQERRRTHLESFSIDGIVSHGIHEKDLRYIYIDKARLENTVGYKPGSANVGLLKLENFEYLDSAVEALNANFGERLVFRPYWSEFKTLLEAVGMERVSITIILQLIVIVALINIIGFIIFIGETKSQEFFMLRALGLSITTYMKFWYFLLIVIWVLSCAVARGFIFILEEVILKLPYFKLPGDVYVLTDFTIALSPGHYALVYGVSLLWIVLIGFVTMYIQSNKSLLSGLRQGFS